VRRWRVRSEEPSVRVQDEKPPGTEKALDSDDTLALAPVADLDGKRELAPEPAGHEKPVPKEP
jgi:hypothetical protein